MPRMIDLIRASALPATRMHAAARGALGIPASEMIEILVHLANHNRIFGQQAKLTLAGWDEASAVAVASDPGSPAAVLEYLVAGQNLRPALLPALLENPSVLVEWITSLASSGSREIIEAILKSKRCSQSPPIQAALADNPKLRQAEAAIVAAAQGAPESADSAPADPSSGNSSPDEKAAVNPEASAAAQAEGAAPGSDSSAAAAQEMTTATETQEGDREMVEGPADMSFVPFPPDPEADEAFAAFMSANMVEITAEQGKPFQAIGGIFELPSEEEPQAPVPEPVTPEVAAVSAPRGQAAAAAKMAPKKPHPQLEGKRDNTLQKINKLDVKGRIQLAIKGTKEERSILIRDGTKIVALAVLESPKITDNEVEHFAAQKNVLEAVLRAIPMKRRFAKQYSVLRNLVFNPRTPLDVALGLMKHMLVNDLRNLSGNKEVSETVRKLALKMFKQKTQAPQQG